MLRKTPLALLMASAAMACATAPAPAPSAPAAAPGKVSMENLPPFDLAACRPPAILPIEGGAEPAATEAVLFAVIDRARARLNECFVEASFLGVKRDVRVVIAVEVDEAGRVASDVRSTAEDQVRLVDCVRAAIGELRFPAATAGQKVAARYEYDFKDRSEAAVVFGKVDGVDVLATIRVNLVRLCPCFEPYLDREPPDPFALKFKLLKEVPGPQEIEYAGPTDEPGLQMAGCLRTEIGRLEFGQVARGLQVYAPFSLVNSRVAVDLKRHSPELRWRQMLGRLATQRTDSELTAKETQAQVARYNELVEKLNRAEPGVTAEQVVPECQAVVDRRSKRVEALDAERRLRSEGVEVLGSLGADARWGTLSEVEKNNLAAVAAAADAERKELEALRATCAELAAPPPPPKPKPRPKPAVAPTVQPPAPPPPQATAEARKPRPKPKPPEPAKARALAGVVTPVTIGEAALDTGTAKGEQVIETKVTTE